MPETSNSIWDQFLIIKNFKQNPLLSALLQGYEGENLIGYTYIDHEQGITLEILKLFTENNEDFIATKDFVADRSRAILRFEQFSQMNFEIANTEYIKSLETEIPGYLKDYQRKDLEFFRTEKAYDKFRTPGFPDDIQILLIDNKNSPELIWARVESYNNESKTGISTLIVQPHQNFSLNKNDDLIFKLMMINNQQYPVGIIENKPKKKRWKFW